MIEKEREGTSSWTNLHPIQGLCRYNIKQDQTNFIILSHPAPWNIKSKDMAWPVIPTLLKIQFLSSLLTRKKYIPSLPAKCIVTFTTLYHVNKIKLPVHWATDPKKLRVYIKSGSYHYIKSIWRNDKNIFQIWWKL